MPIALEISLRTLASIASLFFLTKLLGKRQVTELSVFEYITGITLGSIAAYVSLDLKTSWYYGVLAMAVWVAVCIGIEFLQLKSRHARQFIDGKPTVLIKEGKIMEENLKKERLTVDELLQQLRSKNVFRAADVEFALMESSGEINVLLTRETQPLTPKHLGIAVAHEQEPQTVIIDGEILPEPLATIGLNLGWLHATLEKIGVLVENVVLGQVDAYGQLTVDTFDDQLKIAKPQEAIQTFIQFKRATADLEKFALATQNEDAKALYTQSSQQLHTLCDTLKPLLLR